MEGTEFSKLNANIAQALFVFSLGCFGYGYECPSPSALQLLQTASGIAEQQPHVPVTSTLSQPQAQIAGDALLHHPAGTALPPCLAVEAQ
ncbi:hypothetical protein L3X38_011496 [Prunus dulcis]|uniref:Uncharacterized protein n=1 Tax=Prunus dulcis TaxID=3755 RepID=A0AAD4WHM4_PRUDU|nr:hypothetical protein L3X38_011496 [Prunus dulcis]